MINKYWVAVNYKYNQASPVHAIKDQKQAGGGGLPTYLPLGDIHVTLPKGGKKGGGFKKNTFYKVV